MQADAGKDKSRRMGSTLSELSFAGNVARVPAEDSGGAAEAESRDEEGVRRVDFKRFSFPHSAQHTHPHLQKVAEEANGQLMDEMTRVPTGQIAAAGAESVSSVIPGLEGMSGTQMIHAVLADMHDGEAAP